MSFILQGGKRYEYLAFESEDEFEKTVIAHSVELFGKDAIYLDSKKLIARRGDWRGGIPDGFLIDLSDPSDPHLYFVENELSSHEVYRHIAEQVARFLASAAVDTVQVRSIITAYIRSNEVILQDIEKRISKTQFHNLDELMVALTEKPIRIVVAIDEETDDLNHVLSVFQNKPDTVVLQRYVHKNDYIHVCDPMRDELIGLEKNTKSRTSTKTDYDTIVCPAFEEGFKSAFLEQNAWWAIRMSQEARERVKYLAIYEKKPVAAVRYVAEVDRIESYKNSGKFIVYLKNKKRVGPIKLDIGKRALPHKVLVLLPLKNYQVQRK